jgi:putative hydrolase of the HAD superfamily
MIFSARPSPPDLDSIRVVSWDVDGTLYSIRRAAWQVARRAAKLTFAGRRLYPIRELAELGELLGRVERARADATNRSGIDAGFDRRRELEGRWWAPAIETLGPRPGVKALLGHFQGRVRAQVVLTDYEADYKLQGLGLAEYFTAVYVGERMGSFKPSPAPYARILEDFGLAPECMLHIGDRVDTDGAGAAAAGCPSLVLRKDFRSFGELYTMLAAKGRSAPP